MKKTNETKQNKKNKIVESPESQTQQLLCAQEIVNLSTYDTVVRTVLTIV